MKSSHRTEMRYRHKTTTTASKMILHIISSLIICCSIGSSIGHIEAIAAVAATTTTSDSAASSSISSSATSLNVNQIPCKKISRVGQQITSLSQLQASELCHLKSQQQEQQNGQQPQVSSWLFIEELNLSHNNLSVLHDSSQLGRLTNLLELNITYNQLTRCEENSLLGLKQLRQLDLSHNKLMALPGKFFQPVKITLKRLNISSNSISVLVPSLFDGLNQLEHLDLSHNDITSHWITDKLFKDLTQLRYLDLSFNKLTVFSSPMTFSSLLQLDSLALQHNELRQIPETIGHLRFLNSLDLSHNSIHDITNASYQSNCRLLFNLNLEYNQLDNITRDAFRDLPTLRFLNLANNRIHHLDQQAFEDVPYLHALRLDSNRLIDFGQAFVNLRFLLMLNISSNRISSFDYLQIPSGLQWLDLHSNKIDKLNNYWASPQVQQQLQLQVASSNDSTTGGQQQWQSTLRLTTLDASHNLIRDLDNTSLPDSLETVQLNNNQIKSIASQTFATKSNLTRINLSHNQLSILPVDALKLQGISLASAASIQQQRDNNMQQQQKFVDIYLANNPFICNCNMGWLSQLLLASSTLVPSGSSHHHHNHYNNLSQSNFIISGNSVGGGNQNNLLMEQQAILLRQLPRVIDAHLISCHLHFARQSNLLSGSDSNQWSPIQAAQQVAAANANQVRQINSRDTQLALLKRQSELLSSVHLCTYKSHCIALCYCCDFDACDCEMSCPDGCSCYYGQTWSTNVVDCSANNQLANQAASRSTSQSSLLSYLMKPTVQSNQVKFVNIPEKIPMDVTELYLDGLELISLKGNALIGRRNLKVLYLNNSQIFSIEQKALATQKSLRVLQLNSNYLTELHGFEFEQQLELRELYLANNRLTNIANSTFSSLKALQVLHLQNNQLYHLNFWSNLPANQHKLISVNLGSNPWSCQCDQVEPMLQWLQLNIRSLHDRKSITCQFNRTNSLHLLAPLLANDQDANSLIYNNNLMDENYPMFDLRMCLNHTVYPATIQSTTISPSQPISIYAHQNADQLGTNNNGDLNVTPMSSGSGSMGVGQNSILFQNPPNDEPSRQATMQPNGGFPLQNMMNQFDSPSIPMNSGNVNSNNGGNFNYQPPDPYTATNTAPSSDYIAPPSARQQGSYGASFILGSSLMMVVLIVAMISLLHYRRPMRKWFYSRYGLAMFSATKSNNSTHHNHHGIHAGLGSLGKHQLHHHHSSNNNSSNNNSHLQHTNQYGASSAGSTSSSSNASSNLSQALCHQQQQFHQHHQSSGSSGLVTTPLILASSNSQASSSPYTDDEKLFDVYLTYSKLDEQFVNEFVAPELEYGQPACRVALHYRDLPVVTTNEFLTDCIIETANASRKMVLLLSEQLLRTEWMQYEFRAAHLEALRSNYKHRLIVIILGDAATLASQLDGDLLNWLKSCTCIHWGDKMFWPRLRAALPDSAYGRSSHSQYMRYQTLACGQAQNQQSTLLPVSSITKQRLNLGANLLKSTGLFGGGSRSKQQQQQQNNTVAQLMHHSTLGRPLPHQPIGKALHQQQLQQPLHQQEEHHYAHLTPATMTSLYNQSQAPASHTYHQPIYGDPQQAQQQQQQQQQPRDNPTVPVHI